jgi:acyl carrier protein
MSNLVEEIKGLLIKSLNLEDITPDNIDASAPLFNEGLGLDSIDALELGIAIQEFYGLDFDATSENVRESFYSVSTLAEFIAARRGS